MRQLFQELKRRNVYRVAVTYAAVAFVTLQAAQLVFPATTLEGLYDKLVVLAFVVFPIALVMAWAFELTPEGPISVADLRIVRAETVESLYKQEWWNHRPSPSCDEVAPAHEPERPSSHTSGRSSQGAGVRL